MSSANQTSEYAVGIYTVVFVPWHSEYLDEDFVAVNVLENGREIGHSGMTHIEPCEHMAETIIEHYRAILGELEAVE